MRNLQRAVVAVLAFVFLALTLASAGITGSVSGVVTDASSAVISGAPVVATDTLTGVKTATTESKELQLRFEAFNVFNHVSFTNPDGNISDGDPMFVNGVNQGGTFGLVSGDQAPRVMQIAAKFLF